MKHLSLLILIIFLSGCSQNSPTATSTPEELDAEKVVDQIKKEEPKQELSEEEKFVQEKKAEFDKARDNHARKMHVLKQEMQAKVDKGEIEYEVMRKALWDAEIAFRNGMTKNIEDAQEKIKEEQDNVNAENATSTQNDNATSTQNNQATLIKSDSTVGTSEAK